MSWGLPYEQLALPADGSLRLRPWRPGDAGAVAAALDDRARRFVPVFRDLGPDAARDFVTGAPRHWAAGRHLRLCVTDASDAVLGSLDLDGLERDGSGELGWWTAPASRGRDVAGKAARLGVRLAFEQLGLRRVWATIDAANTASQWVAAGAGLHLEATQRGADTATGADRTLWRLLADETPLAPQPDLTAGVLHLQPPQPRDAPEVFTCCQDPQLQRLTMLPSPYAESDAAAWCGARSLGMWAGGNGGAWLVRDATTAQLLGSVMVFRSERDPAEIGCWTAASARGRGVATAAVGTLVRLAHGLLGEDALTWQCAAGNLASRRVAQKCGFTLDGIRPAGWRRTWAGGEEVDDLAILSRRG